MVRNSSLFFVSFANSHYRVSGYDILGYRALTQAGIGNGNQCRVDLFIKSARVLNRM